jgi:gentisate 1,2-dioxygenase
MATRARSSRDRDRAAEHTKIYDEHLAQMVDKAGGARSGRKITTAEEAEASMTYWDRRGHGVAYLVVPQLGFDVRTLFTFLSEMGPNSETEIHRHMNEAVIYIVEGSGYTIFDVNGERVEWKVGDTLSIPQWAWHQHFNPTGERVRYLATINRPLMEALGLFKIEDYAPDADD